VRPATALVTGGAGFLGSHLVDALLAAGWSVRVLDDFSTGREQNLEPCRDRIEVLRGDLRDAEAVARAVDGVDRVFHLAALASVPASVADPLRSHAVNLGGTLEVLERSRRAGVRRVVYASSSSVYGDAPGIPKTESMPAAPASPYALHKYAGELSCGLYSRLYGLETLALRFFNVYGPRQDPAGAYAAVVPRFARACAAGQRPRIDGDGHQTRDFVFVGDAVRALLRAAECPGAAGAALNVASGRGTSILELWKAMREVAGGGLEPLHAPPRPGDLRESVADPGRAAQVLGFEASVALDEGLRRTLEGPGGSPS